MDSHSSLSFRHGPQNGPRKPLRVQYARRAAHHERFGEAGLRLCIETSLWELSTQLQWGKSCTLLRAYTARGSQHATYVCCSRVGL